MPADDYNDYDQGKNERKKNWAKFLICYAACVPTLTLTPTCRCQHQDLPLPFFWIAHLECCISYILFFNIYCAPFSGSAFIISHNNLTVRHKSVESAGCVGAVNQKESSGCGSELLLSNNSKETVYFLLCFENKERQSYARIAQKNMRQLMRKVRQKLRLSLKFIWWSGI